MNILVVAQHNGSGLRPGSLSALEFARKVAEEAGGHVSCLLMGDHLFRVAEEAAKFATVYVAQSPALATPTADRFAKVLSDVATDHGFDLIVAASNTFTKDFVPRAAGLLGGAMASDVVAHEWRDGELILQRPMFAGAVLATVRLSGSPKIVTIRASAYEPAMPLAQSSDIIPISIDENALPGGMECLSLASKKEGRPDVTEARVVVSGGRALKNSEDFERLVGTLADRLGGATGSSRALVDAGITPNEMQVGQTGKIVAPDLYLALGISGAVQHLAGMKNSKVIAAVNNDPDAPIFEVADYGLVGDVYEIVPQLIAELESS